MENREKWIIGITLIVLLFISIGNSIAIRKNVRQAKNTRTKLQQVVVSRKEIGKKIRKAVGKKVFEDIENNFKTIEENFKAINERSDRMEQEILTVRGNLLKVKAEIKNRIEKLKNKIKEVKQPEKIKTR